MPLNNLSSTKINLSVKEIVNYLITIVGILSTFFILQNKINNNEERSVDNKIKIDANIATSVELITEIKMQLVKIETNLTNIIEDVKDIKSTHNSNN